MNKTRLNSHFFPIISAYNSVFSLGSPMIGIGLLGVTFLHPNIALGGIISLTSAFCFLFLLGKIQEEEIRGTYFLNSLLIGLFIGYLFVLDFNVIFIIFGAAGLNLLITYFLHSILKAYFLPVLSLPFVLVSWAIALGTQNFTNLSDATPYFSIFNSNHLPDVPALFLKSIGAVFCAPDPLVGLGFILLITLYSPMTSVFLILGFLVGYLTESQLILSSIDPLKKFHYFNYSLIFSAIAGNFLIPSRFSIILAGGGTFIAVFISAATLSFWSPFHITALSLPYNLTIILILRTLKTAIPAKINGIFAGSPERNLDLAHLQWLRYRSPEIGIFCPFEGTWSVQQGFYGEWTHGGNWSHALDFVITGKNGKTYQDPGLELTEYYAFGQKIVSPVDGYVINLHSSHKDHAIDLVDNHNNWGNFVLIKSLGGIFVLLAHLKHDSVSVKIGDFVSFGKKVGLCGNTGYSKEPHLHLQIQLSPELGCYTSPFHLLNYKVENRLHFQGIPNKNDQITPIPLNQGLCPKLVFSIGEQMNFELREKNKPPQPIRMTHQLDSYSGNYYWTDGKSRVYYARSGSVFYFYGLTGRKHSPLWDLVAAAPRIPITYGDALSFQDPFPLHISESTLRVRLKLLWKLLSNSGVHFFSKYQMDLKNFTISGKIRMLSQPEETFFKIDLALGIQKFKVGDRHYARLE